MHKSLPFILFIVLLSACSKPQDNHAYEPASGNEAAIGESMTAHMEAAPNLENQNPDNPTLNSQVTTQSEQAHLANKAFVITADASFAVKDVVATKDGLEVLTLQTGGYIQTSKVYNETTSTHQYPIGGEQLKVLTHFVRHGQMTVRIPKARVGEFLKGVQGQMVFLDGQSFHASDVVLDLQRQALHAQIEAERQKRLSDISATSSDDLTDKSIHVDGMIDAKYREMLARLEREALAEQVAFSTISLAFYQNPQIFESTMPDTTAYIAKDERANFAHRLVQSIGQGWLYFLEFILWLVSLWAFVVGLVVVLILWKKVLKPLYNKPFGKPQQPKHNKTTTQSSEDNLKQ